MKIEYGILWNMKTNFYIDYELLDQHIRSILLTHFEDVDLNDPLKYRVKCNVCGDSKTRKHIKRGYILKDKDPWQYYCHNCGYSNTIMNWFKEYFPTEFRQYIKEVQKCTKVEKKIDNSKYLEKIKEYKFVQQQKEKANMSYFVPILKGSGKIFEIAKKVCVDRLIPENVWNSWYVAIDGDYKNRMIIPFYNNKNKIYYYQGRALYSSMIPKYLSKSGDSNNTIYHYYTVDKEKPVIVLEGLIDSEFVENSVAMTGLKVTDEKLKDFPNKYFLLDDDEAGREKSLELLSSGVYVFNWKSFKTDYELPSKKKWDINDVCVHLNRKDMFKVEELEKYFTNNIFNKVDFLK